MNREVHVRFCESRGAEMPPATHPIFADWECAAAERVAEKRR